VNYGLMLARDNRINEAIVQLQMVLTPAEMHYDLGSIYEHEGRKEQARVEFRKALDADPTLADAEVRLSSLR
jgi:Flp pilus assembly protein TadD